MRVASWFMRSYLFPSFLLQNSKEFTDSRWRPGLQGRGNRGGRGSFSARYVANGTSFSLHDDFIAKE